MSTERCQFCVSVRSFVKSTLYVDAYLIVLALPQWMVLSMLASKEHILYTLGCFVASFLLLSVIQKSDTLKYRWPWRWMAMGCCYELLTIGLGTFLMNITFQHTMTLVSASMMICNLVYVICFFIINAFQLPNPYKLAGLAIVGLLQVFVLLAVSTVYYSPLLLDLALLLFVLSILIILVSVVLISYNNHGVLIRDDALMMGFLIYVNYVLIMLACFICYQRFNSNSNSRRSSSNAGKK
ncbi:PREDICTED: uncharacterized protein LOC108609878 [Drosophila arizonae]|uniref:Uncharacterized protein LOC108609878 n=1 Tax=Drosophila arizonae TaxID=7263 RepID=A0ABM1NQA3_DROAR|nr:PREDICTED: uncharacterized protein LOC108609878 [Drosophila arizonae]